MSANPDYPDDRVIAWAIVRGDDGTAKHVPWLRDPQTPAEFELSEQARTIIERAQQQQAAQVPLSGKQRRHRKQRLRQFRSRLRGNPPT